MSNYFKDGSSAMSMQSEEFIRFLNEREKSISWEKINAKNIIIDSLDENDARSIEEVFQDTKNNTGLVASFGANNYLVRDTAMKSICQRAAISGNALGKLTKPVLAEILNHCLKVSKGKALVLISESKISAIHGGDNGDYAVLKMPKLFEATTEYLNENFPKNTFAGGHWSHSYTTAIWELTGENSLIQTYTDALKKHDVDFEELQPALRLISSDVGLSGANLLPTLIFGKQGTVIPLGFPLRLEHKNGATIDSFKQRLPMIFAQYQNALGKLSHLLDIHISFSCGCLEAVMKKLEIPKKTAMLALDMFKAVKGEQTCTAHDIYFALSEIIYLQTVEGSSAHQMLRLEESVARALSLNFKDFDYPSVN